MRFSRCVFSGLLLSLDYLPSVERIAFKQAFSDLICPVDRVVNHIQVTANSVKMPDIGSSSSRHSAISCTFKIASLLGFTRVPQRASVMSSHPPNRNPRQIRVKRIAPST